MSTGWATPPPPLRQGGGTRGGLPHFMARGERSILHFVARGRGPPPYGKGGDFPPCGRGGELPHLVPRGEGVLFLAARGGVPPPYGKRGGTPPCVKGRGAFPPCGKGGEVLPTCIRCGFLGHKEKVLRGWATPPPPSLVARERVFPPCDKGEGCSTLWQGAESPPRSRQGG